MEWQLRVEDASLAPAARHAFIGFLRLVCTPDSDFSSAELVFGELWANTIRHASGPVSIRVTIGRKDIVTLELRDSGSGFTLNPALPVMKSECGRGLYIVRQLCSHVYTRRMRDGHLVGVVLPVTVKQHTLHMSKCN